MSTRVEWDAFLAVERIRLANLCTSLKAEILASRPTEDQVGTELKAAISRIELLKDELSRLTGERGRLSDLQETLSTERQSREELLRAAETELAQLKHGRLCLRDFPPDILRLVMTEAAQTALAFRWTAMAVCREWRAIAASTPALWRKIRVSLNDLRESSLEVTARSLSCGGNCAVDLDLRFGIGTATPEEKGLRSRPRAQIGGGAWGPSVSPPSFDPDNDSSAQSHAMSFDYIQTIAPHLSRCETLRWSTYKASHRQLEPVWLSRIIPTIDMSQLRNLDIDLLTMRSSGHLAATQALCQAATGLASLKLHYSSWYPLSTTSLLSLDLISCTGDMDDLLRVLAGQQSLVSLKAYRPIFKRSYNDEEQPAHSNPVLEQGPRLQYPIQMRSLSYLFWDAHPHHQEESPLPLLCCPILKRAVVRRNSSDGEVSGLVNFFRRSPNLNELSIGLTDSLAVEGIFQALPSVRNLHMIGEMYRQTRWVNYACAPPALRNLRHLSVADFLAPVDILEMLRSRTESGHRPLRSLSAHALRKHANPYNNSMSEADDTDWEAALPDSDIELKADDGWADDEVYWPNPEWRRSHSF